MLRIYWPLLVAAASVGCAVPPGQQDAVAQSQPYPMELSQVAATPVTGDPACRDYTALATIDGKQQQIVGKACRQSDGSWHVTEGPPGSPSEYSTIYWPPTDVGYAYYEPWLWDAPIGFSLGFPFFVDRDHHFHHFHPFFHGGHFASFGGGERFGGFHHFGGFHQGFSHHG